MSVNKGTKIRLGKGVQVADRRRWQSAMTSPIGDVGSERVEHNRMYIPMLGVITGWEIPQLQLEKYLLFVQTSHYVDKLYSHRMCRIIFCIRDIIS